jgi:hypothetical protein
MLKLTLEELADEVAILKQRLDAIAPVAPAEAPPADTEKPPEKKSAMTPKMLDFLRRHEEERVRLGLPKGPTLAEQFPSMFQGVLDLPPDASAQVDHYLYGTPKR